MQCPFCTVEMDEHLRHGVKIDHCAVCGGVWLDKGELDHLVAALRPAVTLPNPEPKKPAPARPVPKAAPRPQSGRQWTARSERPRAVATKPRKARRYTRVKRPRFDFDDLLEDLFDFD